METQAILISENFSSKSTTKIIEKYFTKLKQVANEVVIIVGETFGTYTIKTSKGLIVVPKNYIKLF